MIGKFVGIGITALVGILFIIFGYLIWKKEKISLLHDYHTDKIASENLKVFCMQTGIGMIIIGAALLITAVVWGFTDSVSSFIIFAAGLITGLIMVICAVKKYNR